MTFSAGLSPISQTRPDLGHDSLRHGRKSLAPQTSQAAPDLRRFSMDNLLVLGNRARQDSPDLDQALPHDQNSLAEASRPEDGGKQRHLDYGVRAPAAMLFFLLAGIGFVLGHHFYYRGLDKTVVVSESQQQWAVRIGTLLAFFAKSALVAAVGVAFVQYLWVILQRKAVSLESIDDMFSLTTDLLSFLSPEVLFRANLLVLLALATWLLPLVATVTPATLSIRMVTDNNITDTRVPSPDYQSNVRTWHGYEAVGYVHGAGPPLRRMLSASSSSMGIMPIRAPFPNSSYVLDFFGPSLKCENLAQPDSTVNKTVFDEAWSSALDSLSDLSVKDFLVYNAISPYSSPDTIFVNLNGNSRDSKNISCTLWNASYTVQFEFTDGIQSTQTSLDLLEQISYDPMWVPPDYPPNGEGYQSIFEAFSTLLAGQYGESQYDGTFIQGKTSISTTGVAACPEILNGSLWASSGTSNWISAPMRPWMCRNGTVESAIEDLSRNLTISLLSDEYLSGNTTTRVTVFYPQNHYAYDARELLLAYLIGIGTSLACVLVGLWAWWTNGYSGSTSFSTILLATRNRDLDVVAMDQRTGPHSPDGPLRKAELQYGMIPDDTGLGLRIAFGLRGTVTRLERG